MSIQGNINQVISMAGVITKLSPEHAAKVAQTEQEKQDIQKHEEFLKNKEFLEKRAQGLKDSDYPFLRNVSKGAEQALGDLSEDYARYARSRGNYRDLSMIYAGNFSRQEANQKAADQIEQKRMQKENYMKGRTMLNDFESWTKERGM